MKKLSIITVNYNNLEGLKHTYDSVVRQTYQDFEWIIIDGGSTDGSREFIEQHQDKFSYWCSEPDKGVYNAMNKGIAQAHGEFLNFMNSGDCFYNKDIVGRVFDENPSAEVIYGDWLEKSTDGFVYKKAPEKVTLDLIYHENICHQAMFVKKNKLKEQGYDESYHVYADWARWIEMVLEETLFKYVEMPICIYDVNDGISRRDYNRLQSEYEKMHEIVPNSIRVLLDNINLLKKQLREYQQDPLLCDTKTLCEERRLLRRLTHLNLKLLKCFKKILDFIGL